MHVTIDPVLINEVMPRFVRWRNDAARSPESRVYGTRACEAQIILNTICSELEAGNLLRAVFMMGYLDALDGRGGGKPWYACLDLEGTTTQRVTY